MKLIDKDYAVNTAWSIDAYHGSAREVCEMLEDAPTVDAVQVIRCKDCKHWQYESCFVESEEGDADSIILDRFAFDFCSRAERKEE